jgi:hypothetical protein
MLTERGCRSRADACDIDNGWFHFSLPLLEYDFQIVTLCD